MVVNDSRIAKASSFYGRYFSSCHNVASATLIAAAYAFAIEIDNAAAGTFFDDLLSNDPKEPIVRQALKDINALDCTNQRLSQERYDIIEGAWRRFVSFDRVLKGQKPLAQAANDDNAIAQAI
jgi:hypothetical protein